MAARSKTLDLAYGEPPARLIEELRRKIGGWEASARAEDTFSIGVPALDQLLAANPLCYGMLTEWLSGLARCGAATLSLLVAREACRQGGTLVVIDRRQTFYPPAAAAWGIDLNRLIIVRPRNARDELWAAVQSLRSPAVAAVWAPIERLDARAFRQLQLAAQAGRTLGLLLRPSHVRGQPSWADVQLCVEGKLQNANCKLKNANCQTSAMNDLQFAICNLQSPLSAIRCLRVRALRTRHGRPGGSVLLEIDDAAHTIQEAKQGSRLSAVGYQPKRSADSRQPKADSQHELPLHLVPELADPTAAFSARA
jgi:cell division inhibitor SulA